MFSTDFIFKQQENLVDNQKCQAGFRPLCNKIQKPYKRASLKITYYFRALWWVLRMMVWLSMVCLKCQVEAVGRGQPRPVGRIPTVRAAVSYHRRNMTGQPQIWDPGVVHQILSPILNSESTNFYNEYLL